jgi:hypothetical protein
MASAGGLLCNLFSVKNNECNVDDRGSNLCYYIFVWVH